MTAESWLIGRQPILHRSGAIHGYELLFRSPGKAVAVFSDPTVATAKVVLGALSGFGLRELLGHHRGFINVDRELLFSDALEILPREQLVLELLESIEPSRAVVQRCRELKAAGFVLSLDDHLFDQNFKDLYPLADLVKVDVMNLPPDAVEATVQELRPYPLKLLAEKVETAEQFQVCLDLGFDFFQGFHFARPAVLERRKVDTAASTVLKVLRLLAEDAEVGAIERAFKESPGLTYKLLVLVNSVAVASRERITSVRHAITMLGRKQMRRWLQLALFAADERRALDDPLLDMAAVRAGFMEGLARLHPRFSESAEAQEQAFMAGILSLLDALYAVSMPELVEQLRVSEAVAEALTRRQGPLGELLEVVEALERFHTEDGCRRASQAGIGRNALFAAQRAAFAWRSALE